MERAIEHELDFWDNAVMLGIQCSPFTNDGSKLADQRRADGCAEC